LESFRKIPLTNSGGFFYDELWGIFLFTKSPALFFLITNKQAQNTTRLFV